jgi:uncharacterized protein (DUF1015 family)
MEVKPFRAYRFNADVVGDVGDCIAPPYDVISPQQQDELYNKSEYNIVRITKGKTSPSDNGEHNQYTRAADYLKRWIENGALRQDQVETLYGYIQDFEIGGEKFRRFSFIALARLEELGKTVRPHERVFERPMIDRLNLNRATRARFGLVFMLYEDQQKIADKIVQKATENKPLVDFIDDHQVRQRLFAITSKEDINKIVSMMRDKICVIADGHHRYITGLTESKKNGSPEAQYLMISFTNALQKGLVILATHRIVGGLKSFDAAKFIAELEKKFEISRFIFNKEGKSAEDAKQKMLKKMKAELKRGKNALGIYCGNSTFYVAAMRDTSVMDASAPKMSKAWRDLDVAVLQKLVLEEILGIDENKMDEGNHIEYVKDSPTAVNESVMLVNSGRSQVAFFISPVNMEQITSVTDADEIMPQKSTYFFPKMYTGLTIQKL